MENKEKWWKTMENDGKRGKTMENDGKWLALTTCLWPPGVQSISLRKWRKTRLVTVGPCSESTHHSKSGKPKIPFRCYGCGISVAMWRKCGENVEQSLGSQQPRHWSRLSSRAKLRHPRIQHGLIGEVSSPFFTIGLPLVSWPMDDFGFRSPTYEAQHFFGVGKLRWKKNAPSFEHEIDSRCLSSNMLSTTDPAPSGNSYLKPSKKTRSPLFGKIFR